MPGFLSRIIGRQEEPSPDVRLAEAANGVIQAWKEEAGKGDDTLTLHEIDPRPHGLRLVQGEDLFAVAENVKRLEYKSSGRFTVSALRVSVPLLKGVGLRAYHGRIRRPKDWIEADTGRLFVTSNAIVFDGEHRNIRVTLGQILKYNWASDELKIEPKRGAIQVYSFQVSPEFLATFFALMEGEE